MKTIALISDNHSYVGDDVLAHLKEKDEIWHAGDIGDIKVSDELKLFKPLTAVYGNIDNASIRLEHPRFQIFKCENIKVVMTHIGGYPKRYESGVLPIIRKEKPTLFISGHSHILKVINDSEFKLLHINPGAAGKSGFHKLITFLRFTIDDAKIKDLEIMEIKR